MQTVTLPSTLSFDTPPAPVLYSVTGCSVVVGNGTSNCSLPSTGNPIVLDLVGANLYWQSLFTYVGGIYCPGDLFYNRLHFADAPYNRLRVRCYQASYLTESWSSLTLIISDTPFGAAVVEEAVYFVGAETATINVNTTNLNLLFLLVLLLIPIVIVLVATLYFKHTQPYRTAMVILAKLRAAQRRQDNKQQHETSDSPHPNGNFEMAPTPAQMAALDGGVVAYRPPVVSDVKQHSGSGEEGVVVDGRLVDLDEYGTSSQLGHGEISRIEPLI